ncbi:MAG: hypothetical protein RIE86_16110 [Imperialibacter sp.]|uniref:hypothetical protein n=1 Tax=Imperialibacter sp. TaxID=2038411 RepID=UPI0032ED5F5A
MIFRADQIYYSVRKTIDHLSQKGKTIWVIDFLVPASIRLPPLFRPFGHLTIAITDPGAIVPTSASDS